MPTEWNTLSVQRVQRSVRCLWRTPGTPLLAMRRAISVSVVPWDKSQVGADGGKRWGGGGRALDNLGRLFPSMEVNGAEKWLSS